MISYIYLWSCIDSPDLSYVGSTWNMVQRKSEHKCYSKTSEYKTYIIVRENGGYDNFIFEVLEEYECNNENEKCMREQHWIDTLNPSMNSYRAYSTEEQKKEHDKVYYQQHKEERKQWYQENKEHKKEKTKKYQQKNNEIIECDCGSKYVKYNHSIHIKTKRHNKYINNHILS